MFIDNCSVIFCPISQYEPYGETMLDLFGLTRQSYIGKEKDKENNLGDHGVRKYDYETGRFNSIDPLWDKFYGWNPYQYCFNNPIRFYDNNGLLPGDPFESEAQAAHDFGKNYGNLSFALNAEISTSIYKYQVGDKTNYTYAVPNVIAVAGSNSDYSTIDKEGYEKTAKAHTHGPYWKKGDEYKKKNEDDFSGPDKETKINSYLITPGGYLKLYISGVGSKGLTNDMPKDNKKNRNEYWFLIDNNPDDRPLPIIYNNGRYMEQIDDAKTGIER